MRNKLLSTALALSLLPMWASAQTIGMSSLVPQATLSPGDVVLLRRGTGPYNYGAATAAAIVNAGISSQFITANCNTFTAGLPGCVPASGGGTANFLRADGVWAQPFGSGGSGSLAPATTSTLGGIKASATIAVSSDGTATLSQAGATAGQVLVWNGSAWLPATPANGGAGAADVPSFSFNVAGRVGTLPGGGGSSVLRYVTARTFTLAANLAAPYAAQISVGTNPTAASAFTLNKQVAGSNSYVPFGTLNIATSGALTVTSTAATFNAGDVLVVTAPNTADATLGDVALTFTGSRS